MTWFEDLTGFRETSPSQVRQNLTLDGETLTSQANGRVMTCGRLATPTLGELRERVLGIDHPAGALSVREVVADVRDLHTDPANAGALFQVASQFNLLEMTSPNVTPERGVGIYEHDRTQGPACAVAAGAGTIYRNYFVPVGTPCPGRCPTEPSGTINRNDVAPEGEQIGQSKDHQIDCLADLGRALGNDAARLWEMRNGYALATHDGLSEIAQRLHAAGEKERDALRGLLRIGVQSDTEVTLRKAGHLVSQAYGSALPVAYAGHSPDLWEPFARLVLEAAYEATMAAALLNRARTGNKTVYLTLLGGGVFGNRTAWIIDSLRRALRRYVAWDLNVAIVSYGASNDHVRRLVTHYPNA
jgi:hypothetical protein